jgi:hypothetical protein
LLTVIGTFVPLSPQDAQQIADSTNQTIAEGTANGTLALSIFTNNFPLCLLMFVPIVGTAFGFLILFDTGVAIGSIISVQTASVTPGAVATLPMSTVFLLLVLVVLTFVLEYVSYSIAISESIWLFRRLTQRRWRELKNTGILIGLCALLLTIGALVETWAITM